MQINPYLNFNGQCEAAFKFYEQALGGKIQYMGAYGETPSAGHVPPEWKDKIMHATLNVDGALLMGADPPPGQYQPPQGVAISLQLNDPARADRIFAALAEGGTVQMPIQQTFWAARFGMLTDRFGIPWMINCEQKGPQ